MEKRKNSLTLWLDDLHAYSDVVEYLIKLIIWGMCWLGGIHILEGQSDSVNSAFFVFSLSQAMEFFPRIRKRHYVFSRLCYGAFCSVITAELLISAYLLFVRLYDKDLYGIMYACSVATLVYMAIDWVTLLGWGDDRKSNFEEYSQGHSSQCIESEKEHRLSLYEERMQNGALGDIGKESD